MFGFSVFLQAVKIAFLLKKGNKKQAKP